MSRTGSNKYKKPNLTAAIDADGNWKHVNQVPTGLECNCYCPHCKSRLIAINSKPEGESKAHHFAHERGSDCIWSDESSLHKLAKEVLAEEQKIMLPPLYGENSSQLLEFDCVDQEKKDQMTGLVPDCVCYYGDQKLWVEFKRFHEVDSRKAEKIRNAKIDCIEVDLNKCAINKEAVRRFIVDDSSDRIWIYNSKTNESKKWEPKGERAESQYSEHQYINIDRHFAFDEMARLVNLYDHVPGYDRSAHRFYCLSCGKELRIIDHHFEHIEENKKCVDNIYLMKAAAEVIYYNFYNNEDYSLTIPQQRVCERIGSCEFANTNLCFVSGREKVDLKSIGYSLCEKSVKAPGKQDRYDIVIRKPESLVDAIVINLSTEDCDRDLDSGFYQEEIPLANEEDVMALAHELNIDHRIKYNESSSPSATPKEIGTNVQKFS